MTLCTAGDVKKLLLLTIYIGCEKSADKWQNLESKKNFHIFFILSNLELNLMFEMADCWYLSFSTYSLGQLNIQHNLNIHPHCRNGIGSPKNVKSSCDRSSEIESSKISKTLTKSTIPTVWTSVDPWSQYIWLLKWPFFNDRFIHDSFIHEKLIFWDK